MLNFDISRCCLNAKLCFSMLSLAVFAQYEDHLSIYDWSPDQTLWDWLPGVACYPLKFQRSTGWDSGSLPRSCLHCIILLMGAAACCPNLRHKSKLYETIISVTPAQRCESDVLNRGSYSSQDCCDVWELSNLSISMSQLKSLWTVWIYTYKKFFIFTFSCFQVACMDMTVSTVGIWKPEHDSQTFHFDFCKNSSSLAVF